MGRKIPTIKRSHSTDSLEQEFLNASENGDTAKVISLFKHGHNHLSQRTAFHYAIDRGHWKVAKLLLDQGVSIDYPYMGETHLSWAVRNSNIEAAKFLLDHGANLEHQDSYGKTPLFSALRCSDIGPAKLLLDQGANIEHKDENGQTPIFKAIQCFKPSLVKLLLDRGVNIEHEDENGHTPFSIAIQNSDTEVVKVLFLLGQGANIETSIQMCSDSERPLDWAIKHSWGQKREITVKFLLDQGANTEHGDKNGETLLLWAVRKNAIEVVKLLLDRGANVNHSSKNKLTPLIAAICYKNLAMVHLLLDRGANINHQGKSRMTPMIIAIRLCCQYGIVRLLQSIMPRSGIVPSCYLNVVQLLLDRGASVEYRDRSQRTALYYELHEPKRGGPRLDVVYRLVQASAAEDPNTPSIKQILLEFGPTSSQPSNRKRKRP